MEPDEDPQPPTSWYQPPANLRHRRIPPPSTLLNPVSLILAIPIVTLFIIFFLVPPFLHHSNLILRLNSVKRSWDSLNIMLVVFAILCGVFARRDEEAPRPDAADDQNMGRVSSVSHFASTRSGKTFSAWQDFPDRREYHNISSGGGSGIGGLRRSKSSYPDLRQKSLWENMDGEDKSRVFDDFEVDFYRPKSPVNSERRGGPGPSFEADREVELLVREIPVDKFEVRSDPPVPTPPPPPTPPSAATLKRRRSVQSVPRSEKAEIRQRSEPEFVMTENSRPMPPPAPPPPPPPTAARNFRLPEVGYQRVSRNKSSATKEIASSIASLYKAGQRKRKKRFTKTRNIYETNPHNSSPQPQSTPPPPPPPPPPPSKLLQNLFKKNSKSKRVHSIPTAVPPPPPPPPPPNSIFDNLFKTGSKSKRFQPTSASPPPTPSSILNSLLKNGSKSRRFNNFTAIPPPAPPPPPPLPSAAEPSRRRQIITGRPPKPTKSVFVAPPSPPPPPPPLRISKAIFVARGDFVRIRSAHSSRSNSPELEDVHVEVSAKSEGGDQIGPSITCPSPDVNVKADTFIARLRDEWRLEKIKSIREKQISG